MFQCTLSVVAESRPQNVWVGLLARRCRACSAAASPSPAHSPSGRSKQRPHSQWRDRAGFTPDFPVMPLAGTQTRQSLYHEREKASNTSVLRCRACVTSSHRRGRSEHDLGSTRRPARRDDSPRRPLSRGRSARTASDDHDIGQERRPVGSRAAPREPPELRRRRPQRALPRHHRARAGGVSRHRVRRARPAVGGNRGDGDGREHELCGDRDRDRRGRRGHRRRDGRGADQCGLRRRSRELARNA